MWFVVPVRTIHSGPNPRYFGKERGVTWYNLASNQFTGLNAITVPGTLRDSLNLLAVVLEQETELQPTEIMTDTAGYTDTIFGIFNLLGYQFSPRIADVGSARFWRIDDKADYDILNELASNKINMKLIVDHWDDLLRLAGSLKRGVMRAADLTRTLQTNDRPIRLARALQELGRLVKTLYLLRFIDDEAYRRRILVQLNRGEGRHQLARVIFHGKRGELRQRYREGRKINSERSAWSSISSCSGTRSTWMPPLISSWHRAMTSNPKTLRACRRLGQNTSTCSADTHSHCRNWWHEVNSGHFVTRITLPLTSLEILM